MDPQVASRRSAELRAIAAQKGAAHRARRDGGGADIVVLRRHQGSMQGLTEDYLDVYFPTDRAYTPRFHARLRHEADGTLLAEVA